VDTVRAIVLGGFSSGVGKTTLACRLLERLPGWGALKTEPVRDEGWGWEVVRDDAVLRSPRSDTARYLAAGARRAVWLRYRPQGLDEGIRVALSYLEGCEGVVVEGNSAARHLPAARVIVVGRAGRLETKASVVELLARADPLVLNVPAEALASAPSAVEGKQAVPLDAASASDPRTRALVEEIATWARRPA